MRARTLIPWLIVLILAYLLWTYRDAIRQAEEPELPAVPVVYDHGRAHRGHGQARTSEVQLSGGNRDEGTEPKRAQHD